MRHLIVFSNRPLDNASDSKRWLQPNPEALSISCQKTRVALGQSPSILKQTGFGFGERKLIQRSKRTSETQDPVLII